MNTKAVLALLATMALPTLCHAADAAGPNRAAPAKGIEGIWLGTAEPPNPPRRVVFNISRNSTGVLTATFDSPDRGRKDVPVNSITFEAGALHLEVERIGGSFDGTLSDDGTMLQGTWHQEGASAPVKLRRVERAPEVVFMETGLVIAAVIASLLSIFLLGGFLRHLAPANDRRLVALVAAFHVPLRGLAYFVVRVPLMGLVGNVLVASSPLQRAVSLLYAPLTEEPAKLWLLLFPWFRSRINRQSTLWFGLATGVGFGLGEIWLVAYVLHLNGAVAGMPWYLLIPFINERVLVCVNHGVFTTVALRGVREAPARSVFLAMVLHLVGNAPIVLAGGLDPGARVAVLSAWGLLFPVAMVALLMRLYNVDLRKVLGGRAKCPECGHVYQRPWLAVNAGPSGRRYEPCSNCKKWHWTMPFKDAVHEEEQCLAEATNQ